MHKKLSSDRESFTSEIALSFWLGDDLSTSHTHFRKFLSIADLVKVGACVNVCHTSMNLGGLIEQDLVEETKMGTITGLSKWIEEIKKSYLSGNRSLESY